MSSSESRFGINRLICTADADAISKQLPLALVNRYLELKRSGAV